MSIAPTRRGPAAAPACPAPFVDDPEGQRGDDHGAKEWLSTGRADDPELRRQILPASFRKKHPAIIWGSMTGLRDVLVHDCTKVDLMTGWKVVRKRIPEVGRQTGEALK